MTYLVRFLQLSLAIGGAIGAIAAFSLYHDLWVWPMSDLAMRFLAAAASAYLVGGLVALILRSPGSDEMIMATVLIYAVPMVAAIAIGSDEIDWSAGVAWGFLIVSIPAVLISIAGLARGLRSGLRPDGGVPRLLRAFLIALGVAATVVGGWVFIAPREAGTIWPWADLPAWDPLDTRLIASMILTIAGGALLAAWRNRRDSLLVFLPMLWAYCAVASAGLVLHARDAPALRTEDTVYIVIFTLILVGTAALYVVVPTTSEVCAEAAV